MTVHSEAYLKALNFHRDLTAEERQSVSSAPLKKTTSQQPPMTQQEFDVWNRTSNARYGSMEAYEPSKQIPLSAPPVVVHVDQLVLTVEAMEKSELYGTFYGKPVRGLDLREVLEIDAELSSKEYVKTSLGKSYPTLLEKSVLAANETVCEDQIIRNTGVVDAYNIADKGRELRTVEDHNANVEAGVIVTEAQALAALDAGELVWWNAGGSGRHFIPEVQ